MIFNYLTDQVHIKVNLNDKMEDALKKFSEKEIIDLKNVFFLHSGNSYHSKDFVNKKINDLINKNDRKNNNMIFHVEDENISSINSRYSSFIQDNFQENLLGSEEGINNNGNRIIIKRIFQNVFNINASICLYYIFMYCRISM